MRVRVGVLLLTLSSATLAAAQPVPQPFPTASRPASSTPASPTPSTVGQAAPPPTRPGTQPAAPATPPAPAPAGTPTEAMLGVPIYPGAQFLTSYDAGQGQRYYLFGSAASFADLVTYYRNVLKQRGELVFDQPATHMFEVGRFREETMAFPPGVTIKDYTWGNLGGFLNPKRGVQPERFPSVIQIVPVVQSDR